jgi:ribosomal protein S18 acetylase RimI-like enzyme
MTSPSFVVRPATTADAEGIANIFAAGFAVDPPLVWIIPDANDRARLSAAFFRPFVDLVLAGGRGYVNEAMTAATLWLDIDVSDNSEDAGDLRERLIDGVGSEYAKRFFVLDEMFSARHPTHESHAYLVFIGVVPELQGRGIGTHFLTEQLTGLDNAGRPAYLEASSERNTALYARVGFASFGEPVALPDGPSLQPMWRRASYVSAGPGEFA